jgi:hypothetical protein
VTRIVCYLLGCHYNSRYPFRERVPGDDGNGKGFVEPICIHENIRVKCDGKCDTYATDFRVKHPDKKFYGTMVLHEEASC